MVTAHFNPEHQFEAHASADAAGTDDDTIGLPADAFALNAISVEELASEERLEKAEIVGTKDEWREYREKFSALVEEAIRQEIIPNRAYLKNVLKKLPDDGPLSQDANGALWIDQLGKRVPGRVGLSASNIFAVDADGQIGYQIMLARMEAELDSPKHSRETMLEFKQDWAVLAELRVKGEILTAQRRGGSGSTPAPETNSVPTAPSEARTSIAHGGHGSLP